MRSPAMSRQPSQEFVSLNDISASLRAGQLTAKTTNAIGSSWASDAETSPFPVPLLSVYPARPRMTMERTVVKTRMKNTNAGNGTMCASFASDIVREALAPRRLRAVREGAVACGRVLECLRE